MKTILGFDRQPTLCEQLSLAIKAEIEAVQEYKRLADSVDDPKHKELLRHIAEDEQHHISEFMQVFHPVCLVPLPERVRDRIRSEE